MQYRQLGHTGLQVSELCFGVLPLGPLQADISVDDGAELMLAAMENGVNFFDTAQSYQTYPHLAKALRHYPEKIVIATKSTATDYAGMEKAICEALQALSVEYIDIFHLHAARVGVNLLEERAGAWQCLLDYQQKGYIRAVGVSTHNAKLVAKLADVPELDVIFPLVNKAGLGILEGNVADMQEAMAKAVAGGKGIYAMKALAGGALLDDYLAAINFVRDIPGVASVAIGMVKMAELELNLRLFQAYEIEPERLRHLKNGKEWGLMKSLCKGCGCCVAACPNQALSLQEGKSTVDKQKCILCGYCVPTCPEFAIRLR